MKEKPTIVLTSNLYKPNIGGVENSLHHLALCYQKLGYQVIIIASDLSSENYSLLSYEEIDDVLIYRYSMSVPVNIFGINMPKSISGIINAFSTYKKVYKQYFPKFILTRYHFNQVFAKLAGGRNTLYLVPGVVKFQNSSKHIAKRGFREYLQWRYHMTLQFLALKLADRVAVFSHNMVNQVNLACLQKKQPLLTKPGVDSNRFLSLSFVEKKNLRLKLNAPCSGKVFLCVGRCVKAKGFDLAINAFVSLKNTNHKLWLVGDGPLIHEYKALVITLGLKEQVVFWGKQSKPETFYAAADFFIMSSIYEPLGQTILEGLSAGLPIVAFKPSKQVETASNELITFEHGVFVSRPEVSLLSETLINMSNYSDEYYQKISTNCRSHVIDNFTWLSLAQVLLKEFDNDK